ncbi:MAG: DUF1559 domain-containing protein [Planctomycetaceae bacterium]|nr:DUF1559 domain-containing protein [Planctomycetaceae bacterium]
MPFLEQSAVFESLTTSNGSESLNQTGSMDAFLCPSFSLQQKQPDAEGLAPTNYLMCCGKEHNGGAIAVGYFGNDIGAGPNNANLTPGNLIVPDGMSNTMMFSEGKTSCKTCGCGGHRYDRNRNCAFVTSYPNPRFLTINPPVATSLADKNDMSYCHDDGKKLSANSNHAGGVNLVKGDGSGGFASFTIALDVWQAISIIQDGEALSLP